MNLSASTDLIRNGSIAASEPAAQAHLLVLDDLGVLEEAPHLAQDVAGPLRVIGVVCERRVAHADSDELVVEPLLVAHAHDANRAGFDDRERHHGLLAEHQGVERVAVFAEGPGDEGVVGGIVHGAVEYSVELQQARFLVELILVLAPRRHFEDDGECLLDEMIVNVDVVPSVHAD